MEPFLNGVASCLRHTEESGVQNVRLHMGDEPLERADPPRPSDDAQVQTQRHHHRAMLPFGEKPVSAPAMVARTSPRPKPA